MSKRKIPTAMAALLLAFAPVYSAQAVDSMVQVQCDRLVQFCHNRWQASGYSSEDECLTAVFDAQCVGAEVDEEGHIYGNPYLDITYGCGSSHVTC